jgi:hypothetical protein
MIALTGVTIIYFGDFRLGAMNFDLSIYLFIALALGILAVVVPTI